MTSRALPLLYLSEMAKSAGLLEDPDLHKRVQEAIYRVLSYQSSSGSFGLWGPGSGDLWLDAYVSDFLTRARDKGFQVPEKAIQLALDHIRSQIGTIDKVENDGVTLAYGLYVLARNGRGNLGDLRYLSDQKVEDFKTPLGKAQLAAALALMGDKVRAERVL